MERTVVRVGFAQYPPALMYDSGTKEFSGIFYEVLTHIADRLNWQLEWMEEV